MAAETLKFGLDYWMRELTESMETIRTAHTDAARMQAADAMFGAAMGLHEFITLEHKEQRVEVEQRRGIWEQIYRWWRSEE